MNKPIKPQLCKLMDTPFDNPDWSWEMKYDGIRLVAEVIAPNYQIWSRSGREITMQFPELKFNTSMPAILDGELVCYDARGISDFQAIQHRTTRQNHIKWAIEHYPVFYEVFDVLEIGGTGMIGLPLIDRRKLLAGLVTETENVRVAKTYALGTTLFTEAETKGYEGVVGKLNTSKYKCGDRADWVKVKVGITEDFLICGFTQGTGWRAGTFGALVLGKIAPDGTTTYVGEVGTGFEAKMIATLMEEMAKQPKTNCPFVKEPDQAVWIQPNLKAKVHFAEYTNEAKLRFPSFKGLA